MSTCRTARVMAAFGLALLGDRDGDLPGNHRWIVGDVILVSEQQLQGVLAGCERGERRLGLALAEVHDLVGRRQRCGRIGGRVGVDEQVVMAGVFELHSRRRDTHALQTELHPYRAVDRGAILGTDDVDLRARGRGGALRSDRGGLGAGERGGEHQGGNDQCTHGQLLTSGQQWFHSVRALYATLSPSISAPAATGSASAAMLTGGAVLLMRRARWTSRPTRTPVR